MVFQSDSNNTRLGRFAAACQHLLDRLSGNAEQAPRVQGSGESSPLPRPGVYALLAGFDRRQ